MHDIKGIKLLTRLRLNFGGGLDADFLPCEKLNRIKFNKSVPKNSTRDYTPFEIN